jgi:serine/threonine protein kinase
MGSSLRRPIILTLNCNDLNYFSRVNNFSHKKKGWGGFMSEENKALCNDEAFDLLNKLIVYDPEDRLTCEEAMNHPYFEPVRYKIR